MYKKQLKFQRVACFIAMAAAALWFVYSLGIITDIYDALYYTMQNPKDLSKTLVPGSILYYDMQAFNKSFLYAAIGMILLACLLFITNTHTRRRYYIANYIAAGAYSLATVALSIWSHCRISAFKTQFLDTVDFEALLKWSAIFPSIKYTESTLLLDLHYAVMSVALLATAALAAAVVWKVAMMRAEQQLVEAGKEAVQ